MVPFCFLRKAFIERCNNFLDMDNCAAVVKLSSEERIINLGLLNFADKKIRH